ncbi:MAG TPA: hypothetical protein VLH08_21660 [Acidobacteriota bacterium]|nr:hypothetical protein [Acidobacteriota bacterium]
MYHNYSYSGALAASEKMRWTIQDVIGEGLKLDFSKPFLPESLARVESLSFLTPDEKIILNQIRGNAYLTMFGTVEEFILPFVMDHARPRLNDDDYRVRSLLAFAGEEAKHIQLFKIFSEEFKKGFNTTCNVIGPPSEIAKAVLSHHPLSVALLTLHIEWFVQRHYIDSIRDDKELDPQFKRLLKYHWIDEAQHTKLDTLMIETLAENCSQEEINKGFEEYLEMGGFIDQGLAQQVQFDLDSFQQATGRKLNEDQIAEFKQVQLQANRWTYIGSGMNHPNFLATVQYLSAEWKEKLENIVPAFC